MKTMKHDSRAGIRYLFRPLYWRRLLLLLLGNVCNVALAVYGIKHHNQDFATYLLMVLMSNLLLYTFFYILMKVKLYKFIKNAEWLMNWLSIYNCVVFSYFIEKELACSLPCTFCYHLLLGQELCIFLLKNQYPGL